jgi:hypothetical protein
LELIGGDIVDELIITEKENLTNIADAVREQTGETELMSINDIPSKIRALSSGGGYAKIEDIPTKVSQLENDSKFVPEDEIKNLFKNLSSDRALSFYCIEDVEIVVNGVSTVYSANSNVEIKLLETDTWEIIPTSNNSI